MLQSLLEKFRTPVVTAYSLKQRKDSILSTFTSMIAELDLLHSQQREALNSLDQQIAHLHAERLAIAEMQSGTEETIEKISGLLK